MANELNVTTSLQERKLTETWRVLSEEQREIFNTICFAYLSTSIGLFGIKSNIINVIIFAKQGFSNTVNISLLGLAISDLCCLLATEWVGWCFNPLVVSTGPPWIPGEFTYLTGAWPHIVFGRITSYITVYVTAERCLCTIAPLKVKDIITPSRATTVISIIYILNILSLLPEYVTSYFEWKFFQNINRTILTISYTSDREKLAGLVYFLSSLAGILSFVAVIFFTGLLVVKIKQSSKWRKRVTSVGDQSGPMSNRDKKTVKMIVLVAAVLIVCYTPGTALTMTTVVEPEFMVHGLYFNIAIAMWSLAFVFQTVNSSVNIFLYYTMSSKYRQTFYDLFGICLKQRTEVQK